MPCGLLHYAARLNLGVSQQGEYVVIGRTITVTLALCVALAGCAHGSRSGNAANELDRLANGFIATLTEQERATLKKAEETDLPMFHFGAGSRVRQLYFGPDGEGRKAFCTPGAYCDIDRESMRIVERAWQIIRGAG